MMKRIINQVALHQKMVIFICLFAAIAGPAFVQSNYILRILTLIMINTSLCLSFNLMAGFTSMFSFAHCTYYGIGAYTVAILTTLKLDMPPIPALIIAVLIAGLMGLVLALPTLRLSGFYLIIASMGMAEIFRIVVINERWLTNGMSGISGIAGLSFLNFKLSGEKQYYYLFLGVAVLFTVIIYLFINSRIGRAIVSCREDPIAAESLGINVFKYRCLTFIVSAMMAGLVGGVYAVYNTYVSAALLSQNQVTQMLSMTLLGGLGSIPGSWVGSIVLTLLPELTRSLDNYRYIFYGLIIIFVIVFLPSGLLGKYNFKYIRQGLLFQRQKRGTEKGANTGKGGVANEQQ